MYAGEEMLDNEFHIPYGTRIGNIGYAMDGYDHPMLNASGRVFVYATLRLGGLFDNWERTLMDHKDHKLFYRFNEREGLHRKQEVDIKIFDYRIDKDEMLDVPIIKILFEVEDNDK